ncbi:putative ankyrin repeat-containing domain-containing protein [Helianthus annuus]|uniref:Ankyrin repeat-containing domain-containing protein n=1 Tax=Helianthus annuus TaxID=4232 RepID=A0A9K3HKX7_HELAN|nr:putative ankyrin repeat-containing domain-containing protein [Helianthus annuus]KAJ0507245.1 putative ankyrin repeat-containing domain-containing protein [Helianthus annuus]KAJ0683788.1 putative ankyrin repeat-containing domain-containing protein [Helianthus annuus]
MQDFVKKLVGLMTKEDLELQNNSSNTALCLAAAAGNVEMVKILVEKNRALLTIPGSQQMMPLYMAALFGQHATVEYLYNESKGLRDDGWNPQNRGWLLQTSVGAELFPFERGSNSGSSKKANEAMQLLRIIWKNIASKPKKEIDDIIRGPPDAVKKDDRRLQEKLAIAATSLATTSKKSPLKLLSVSSPFNQSLTV